MYIFYNWTIYITIRMKSYYFYLNNFLYIQSIKKKNEKKKEEKKRFQF